MVVPIISALINQHKRKKEEGLLPTTTSKDQNLDNGEEQGESKGPHPPPPVRVRIRLHNVRGSTVIIDERYERRKMIVALLAVIAILLSTVGLILSKYGGGGDIYRGYNQREQYLKHVYGDSIWNDEVILKSKGPRKDNNVPSTSTIPDTDTLLDPVLLKILQAEEEDEEGQKDDKILHRYPRQAAAATTNDDDDDGPRYNPNATCVNPVKRGPKSFDQFPSQNSNFNTLENDPISLLHFMIECPSFLFERCTHRSQHHTGFKATVYVRSLVNQSFVGYDTKVKKAKKQAAYFAAKTLYPDATTNGFQVNEELAESLRTGHCIPHNNKDTRRNG